MEVNFFFIKEILLFVIFIVSVLYQAILFFSLWKHRRCINFTSAVIKPDGTVSKSGIMFFILMIVIIYQSLFVGTITAGLIELMLIIVGADVGGKFVDNYKNIEMQKIKKTTYDTKTQLDPNEFGEL